MKIIAGLHLDGNSYPDTPGSAEASQGKYITGPLGLVSLLETRLGIPAPSQSNGVRIAGYMAAMDKLCKNSSPFYAESFKVGPWATAKELLSLRDFLVMSGWKAEDAGDSPDRIVDLITLENEASTSPGLGERLQRIARTIEEDGIQGIAEIDLQTPNHLWPGLWRSLFDILKRHRISFSEATTPSPAEEKTNLSLLKNAFISGKKTDTPLYSDDTIIRLEADTAMQAADTLASWLGTDMNRNHDLVVIAESGGEVLDMALQKHGLPTAGYGERSMWRAGLQLIPLALSLRWEPFNPQTLLEFLTAPLCPVPNVAARHLINALENQPGIGGPAWNDAWEKCREWATNTKQPQVMNELTFWVKPRRFSIEKGMDVEEIRVVCMRIKKWSKRATTPDNHVIMGAVMRIAEELAETAFACGRERLLRPQLERMLDSIIGSGLTLPGEIEQAAPWHSLHHPGQMYGPAETVIWWNFTAARIPPLRLPWSRKEQKALTDAGADLSDLRRQRETETAAWKQPILNAGKRLVLVTPGNDRGEELGQHPMWDEIDYYLNLDDRVPSFMTKDISAGQLHPEFHLMNRTTTPLQQPNEPLPAPCTGWVVPSGKINSRNVESPSGMISLLGCPLAWTLNYTLKIRSGKTASLPDGNMLIGNFCHAIIEELVNTKTTWSPTEAEAEAMKLFDRNLEKMAATLRLPGRETELNKIKTSFRRAVKGLFSRIQAANLRIKGSEVEVKRRTDDGCKFRGFIDLLLESPDGAPVVCDLKWSSSSKYRREEMIEHRALQLAAYAWMLNHDQKQAGYFMLNQNEFIATDEPWVDSKEAVSTDLGQVWETAFAAYMKRLEQLESGRIEAPGADGETSEVLVAGFPAQLKCGFCEYDGICGRRYA